MTEERHRDESALDEHMKAKRATELAKANEEKAELAEELSIAKKELVFQNRDKEKLEDELIIANKEKKKLEDELIKTKKNLAYQYEEKANREEELVIANREKSERAAELIMANVLKAKSEAELLIAHIESAKHSSELAIAQKELDFNKNEETKRSAELITANIDKAKIAAELVIANIEKAKRAAEIAFLSKELLLSHEKERLRGELLKVDNEINYEIEKRNKYGEELNEVDDAFRSLAESIPQIVWTTLADGWCIYINQHWVDYTGLTYEESYGHGWNTPFHPEDKQQASEAWQNAENNNTLYSIECRLRRYDGTYHWWLIRGVSQISAKSEIMWIGTCTDIEKIKETELALKESKEQLLRLNADKDRFISLLGHDLKSPFTALIGISDLLIENLGVYSVDKTEELLNHLKSASTETFALLEDLLAWTNSHSGFMPFNPQILDFSKICKNKLESLKPIADSKNITIKISAINNISVFADINMLKTVVRNLFSNAIKFTNKGGIISISAEEDSENVTITVSDNGIGMNPDELNKLFNILHRQSKRGTNKESGTGMGLFICKEFVEKHGGKIWAESEVGKGSDFKFTLPVVRIHQ
jgi:PAS domain S-box-containing protein